MKNTMKSSFSPRDVYCYARAAELLEARFGCGHLWTECYKQAEAEYDQLNGSAEFSNYNDEEEDS